MKVSERMRSSWSAFRAGQSAQKAGVQRIDNPYNPELAGFTGLSAHDMKVREKAWFDGWDKPNK